MAKGSVSIELDIEVHIIDALVGIRKHIIWLIGTRGLSEGERKAERENLQTKLSVMYYEVRKLENLEYRENAPQKWKKWEMSDLNLALKSIDEARLALQKGEKSLLESADEINKAIAEIEKLKRYELRIGG
jgi:hypothetical protein